MERNCEVVENVKQTVKLRKSDDWWEFEVFGLPSVLHVLYKQKSRNNCKNYNKLIGGFKLRKSCN